ncbi:hypothetical protein CWI38_0807p0020 [Hamiltosporidium tvaerminnensis]|uniref:Uncharacterized protein n=3 Tax=Hamiltosporidium TaxID=1176354 RepID=A0A4Q9LUR2_9MICR|nr:hypothetical protein LUQ84_000845 [Hamiltosporidium tvaerminnensis]TBU03027.1 hypothetical protein CWI37_0369p0020 [Hamiltosporidium tvaerminnensis]TBU09881.1 hypothetical protein CWI39_0023p0020 [Hamiltosporidium magnivora]TBU12314.1 hypothetical protein CWI38_0807p0020 [Hamiltosporidium tvaerminnensis]
MILEIFLKLKRCYIYSNEKDEIEQFKLFLNSVNLEYKETEEKNILSLNLTKNTNNLSDKLNTETEFEINELKCKCGNNFDIKSFNRLPTEGWQEYIDMWSCHNLEFKEVAKLEMRPRKKGILYSNFYFFINKNDFPCSCFQTENKNNINVFTNTQNNVYKVFFNQISLNISDNTLIFIFFKEYFLNNNEFIFQHENINYEIKYFEDILIYEGQYIEIESLFKEEEYQNKLENVCKKAIKIGFKESDMIVTHKNLLNIFFCKYIYNICVSKSIPIKIMDYNISFITE